MEGWSINRLAHELGLDRRTVTKRLAGVAPLADTPQGPIYSLADAARAVFGHTTSAKQEELKTRILKTRAEDAEIKLAQARGELINRKDVERAAFTSARSEREALLLWPDRVAAVLAADLDVEQVRLATVLDREIRTFLEERSRDS